MILFADTFITVHKMVHVLMLVTQHWFEIFLFLFLPPDKPAYRKGLGESPDIQTIGIISNQCPAWLVLIVLGKGLSNLVMSVEDDGGTSYIVVDDGSVYIGPCCFHP